MRIIIKKRKGRDPNQNITKEKGKDPNQNITKEKGSSQRGTVGSFYFLRFKLFFSVATADCKSSRNFL